MKRKKLLVYFIVLIAFITLSGSLYGQWATTGALQTSPVYTGGKVGIGTSNPFIWFNPTPILHMKGTHQFRTKCYWWGCNAPI